MVSAGKTNRDIPTLLEALRRSRQPARVYSTSPGLSDVANARVISPQSQGRPLFEFGEVLEDMRRASIVAIPIADPERLTGLSELNDAMALEKPVIVTRSPQLDLDIEEIGCGIWVNQGNADAWTRAIERLASDPAGAAEMGRNGRRFAESAWNNDLFGRGVVDAFGQLPLRSPRPQPDW